MEQHHTQRELEDIFFRATLMALGFDPDAMTDDLHKRVRFSWPYSTNSDWQRDENVVFVRISPRSDPYGETQEPTYEKDENGNLKEIVRYHRCYSIDWVCYGPESDQYADAIRIGILSTSVHSYLMQNNIAILPSINDPVYIPEQDATGDWWQRHDLHAEMYEGAQREYAIPCIGESPDVSIAIKEG